MQCGSKCFIVTMEVDGERIEKTIRARTSIAARKRIRKQYGDDVTIVAAKEERR